MNGNVDETSRWTFYRKRGAKRPLSPFQEAVTELALEGKTDPEIAALLNKHVSGVREALRHVFLKRGVKGRRELIIQHYQERIRELEMELAAERGRNAC